MAKLTFKTDNCKGCGLCVDACPKGLLRLSEEKILCKKTNFFPVAVAFWYGCVQVAKAMPGGLSRKRP
mgnify:CR=1 FL=1